MRLALTLSLLLLTAAPLASAEVELDISGKVQTNLRFRVEDIDTGRWFDRRRLQIGVDRNENFLKLKLDATAGDFRGFADIDFVWVGQPTNLEALSDLSDRTNVEPVRIETHALFLEAVDLFADGLDFRIGSQILHWGVGDQFNPTNTVSPSDLEDVLMYGEQQANMMARLDYQPSDYFTFTGVLVPVFKPATLPISSEVAISDITRLPMLDGPSRYQILGEQTYAQQQFGYPTIIARATPELPETNLKNMQFGFRMGTTLFEQDIALTYYQGFSDVPVAKRNVTTQVSFDEPRCNPANPTDCINGTLSTETTLIYPQIRVLGLNVSGEMNPLGWISDAINPIGYWIEVGVYFPEEVRFEVLQPDGISLIPGDPVINYQYATGQQPKTMDSTPFVKWVVGLDYSFGEHVYTNVQWVHGLADEMGAGDFLHEGVTVRGQRIAPGFSDQLGSCGTPVGGLVARLDACKQLAVENVRNTIGDYLVLGIDLKFMDQALLFRIFSILELTGYAEERYRPSSDERVRESFSPFSAEGFSAIVYPELSYNFSNGLNLAIGALWQIGKSYTKFGDPAAGGSLVWTRAEYAF